MSTGHVHAAIYVLAAQQGGLVRVGQVVERGGSRNLLARWARSGRAHRVAHGVYRVMAAQEDDWTGRVRAVALRLGAEASISHWAAARLLGLRLPAAHRRRTPIEVTWSRRSRVPTASDGVHESNVLERGDLDQVQGIRVTGAAFTIGALAPRMHEWGLARLVDAAVADGLTTYADLVALSHRLWSCPGVPTLRAALDRHDPAVVGTRSERERRLLRLLRDAGLPIPQVDVEVTDAAGRTRFLDFAYVEHRVWIEFDSDRFHAHSLGRRSDGVRQNDVVLLDGRRWVPLRFDDRDLFEAPTAVVEVVGRTLGAVDAI